jgi:hypothetical protein
VWRSRPMRRATANDELAFVGTDFVRIDMSG